MQEMSTSSLHMQEGINNKEGLLTTIDNSQVTLDLFSTIHLYLNLNLPH